mmetsp:Transcript_2731/g.4652  ORF Transcript_2731/g.4652 Transcript_2731/m.4652 type:complete len:124 (+) Transcript_2731:1159-1530(+)
MNFDILVESLMQVINRSAQLIGQGLTSDSNLCNLTIEILTYIVKQNYRSHLQTGQRCKNIERFRDDILVAALSAYSPIENQNNHCVTNQVAEDLLEQLVISLEPDFISHSIEPLLREEQPPKL